MNVIFSTQTARPFTPKLVFREVKTIASGLDEVAHAGPYTCMVSDEGEFGRGVSCSWHIDRIKLIEATFATVEEAEREAVGLLRLAVRSMLEEMEQGIDANGSTEALLVRSAN